MLECYNGPVIRTVDLVGGDTNKVSVIYGMCAVYGLNGKDLCMPAIF